VALKKFVDDLSVLAVEACIVESLPALFCPENVLDIKDEMVATLAAEDEDLTAERERCCEKLKVLENGLRELKSAQKHPPLHYKGKQREFQLTKDSRININQEAVFSPPLPHPRATLQLRIRNVLVSFIEATYHSSTLTSR
jgi:hypothetical protein